MKGFALSSSKIQFEFKIPGKWRVLVVGRAPLASPTAAPPHRAAPTPHQCSNYALMVPIYIFLIGIPTSILHRKPLPPSPAPWPPPRSAPSALRCAKSPPRSPPPYVPRSLHRPPSNKRRATERPRRFLLLPNPNDPAQEPAFKCACIQVATMDDDDPIICS